MQIARWGNSLAVRLPAAVVRELGLREGDEVEIVALQRDRWAARPAEVPADFASTASRPMSAPDAFLDTHVIVCLLSADTRKADIAEALVAAVRACCRVVPLTEAEHDLALDLAVRHGLA